MDNDLSPFLLRFVVVEDARLGEPPYCTDSLGKFGWLIDDTGTHQPGTGGRYLGIKPTSQDATKAAVAFIYARRPDIVRDAQAEAFRAHRFAQAKAAGLSGSGIV